jgi:hypothetical protein
MNLNFEFIQKQQEYNFLSLSERKMSIKLLIRSVNKNKI